MIPDSMYVCGYKYKIEHIGNLEDKDDDGEDRCLFGDCDSNTRIIRINSDHDEVAQFSALIHEYIEAVNNHFDLDMSHQTISTLESGMYQFMLQLFEELLQGNLAEHEK